MAISSPKECVFISPAASPIGSTTTSIDIVKNEKLQEESDTDIEEHIHVYPVNRSSNMSAALDTRELWKQFDALGTEMIVTRRGR